MLALNRGRRAGLVLAVVAITMVVFALMAMRSPAHVRLADKLCVGYGDNDSAPAACIPVLA